MSGQTAPLDPAELVIREAEPGDIDTLIRFTVEEAREAEERALDPAVARRAVEGAFPPDPVARYWIALHRGAPVASASVTREWSDWNGAFYWWLQSVYVVAEARGRGALPPLLVAIRAAARAAGAAELRLLVHHENARAIGAYRRQGFEELPYRVMRQAL